MKPIYTRQRQYIGEQEGVRTEGVFPFALAPFFVFSKLSAKPVLEFFDYFTLKFGVLIPLQKQ